MKLQNRGRKFFATVSALILATASLAQADTITGGHQHKGKKGTLKILTPVQVGGVTLQPGDYEVRDVKSSTGDTVEFTHVWQNDFPWRQSHRTNMTPSPR